jgi:ABC-type glycerol-3-phosphate transport system substrate-binding protein
MKKHKLILITFLLLVFISGCAPKDDTPEIIMWLVGSEQQALVINEIGKDFYRQTGVKVKCEAISWGEAHSKYLTGVIGEVAPDIGTMGLTWGTEFGNLGAMIDLKETFPGDIEYFEKEIFPGIWEASEYQGQIYAVPFDMSLQVLYYRTDMIDSPPQTWEELTEVLAKLNQKDKGMIFDWGSLNWLGFAPFLWQAGGDFYNQAGSASALNSQPAARALRYFSNLYLKYETPITSIPVEQGMRTGDYPICIAGNWKINTLLSVAPEIEGKWAIAQLPQGPTGKRTAFIGGRVMGIFSDSKLKEESWEFIKYLSSPEIQLKLYNEATKSFDTYLPPNLMTWEALPMKPSFKEVLKTQALDAKGPPSVLGWDDSTRYIDTAIQQVILNKQIPALVLKDASEELDRRIKKKKQGR